MQCLYKTLDLLPSATDNEIRSAYRRRALSTHPDKGGSAEAFRAVVDAFETLIDASRRSAYDQLRLRPRPTVVSAATRHAAPSPKQPPPARTPTPTKAAKVETPRRPTPPRPPTPPKPPTPPSAASTPPPAADATGGPLDPEPLFRRLLRMPKKRALAELRQLSEEALNTFAAFLASDAESILYECPVLALKDRPKPRAKAAQRSSKALAKKDPKPVPSKPVSSSSRDSTVLKGISRNRRDGGYQARISFNNFMTITQYVKNLDVAVDMHISLVQMRQYAAQGLTEGKDFHTAVQDAIELVQKERAASGALALRLRFRSSFNQKFTLTEHKLDQALRDWEAVKKRKEVCRAEGGEADERQESEAKQRRERREAIRKTRLERQLQKADRREARFLARQRKQELLRSKRQAFARRKLRSLQAFVQLQQAHFEKECKKQLLKTWGVPELPEGLQVSSFLAPDDTLCAMLRLSDGRVEAGPYRKSFQEALRDLQELRVIQQRRGDQALCEEMQRRDAAAMTAFFVQSLR